MDENKSAEMIAQELQGHFAGLRARWKTKGATAAQVASEILGSLYPTLLAVALSVDRLEANAEYNSELFEHVGGRLDVLEESLPGTSQLTPEDASQLLEALRMQTPSTEAQKKAIDEAIELIGEITLQEADDDGDDVEATPPAASPTPLAAVPAPAPAAEAEHQHEVAMEEAEEPQEPPAPSPA